MTPNILIISDCPYAAAFVGYLPPEIDPTSGPFFLKEPIVVRRWADSTHGIFGLVVNGPTEKTTIIFDLPPFVIKDVQVVCRMTPLASKKWEDYIISQKAMNKPSGHIDRVNK